MSDPHTPKSLELRDRNQPTVAVKLADNDPAITDVEFSQDGRRLLIGRKDGASLLWEEARNQNKPRELHRFAGELTVVGFSQTGQLFAAGDVFGNVYHGALSGKVHQPAGLHRKTPVTSLAFSRQ